MFEDKLLLNRIFIKNTRGKEYIIFRHSDKTWILPKSSFKEGMDMYQPSTYKGKLLKYILIVFKNNKMIVSKLGGSYAFFSVNEGIKKAIEENYPYKDIEISGYMGDTSSKQNNKATLQVSRKNKILCYIKVTTDRENGDTFNKEIKALNFLEENKVKGVPQVIIDDYVEGMYIFGQTTEKKLGDKLKLKIDIKQIEFIKNIVDKTEVELFYEESDFYKHIESIKLMDFNSERRIIIKSAIEIIEKKFKNSKSRYSFFHGDYTPWNVYYIDGEIRAFDFEYSKYSMPPYMDIFHYISQLSFLGFNNEVGKTVRIYKNLKKILGDYICDLDYTYISYLVYIIGFYKERTTNYTEEIQKKFDNWFGMLEYLLEKNNL